MSSIEERYRSLQQELEELARADGRPPPTLVVVTKAADDEAVREVHRAGARDLGENRAQNHSARIDRLADLEGVRWHFLGHLQTNKVSRVIGPTHLVHSVDSCRLLESLDGRARRTGAPPVPLLLQVNVSGEEAKHGLSPEGLAAAAEFAGRLEHVEVRGLMTMAPFGVDEATCRRVFATLRELHESLRDSGEGDYAGTELSMGMSQDFRHAVREGATMVRIGTAIFQEGAL